MAKSTYDFTNFHWLSSSRSFLLWFIEFLGEFENMILQRATAKKKSISSIRQRRMTVEMDRQTLTPVLSASLGFVRKKDRNAESDTIRREFLFSRTTTSSSDTICITWNDISGQITVQLSGVCSETKLETWFVKLIVNYNQPRPCVIFVPIRSFLGRLVSCFRSYLRFH